MEARGKVAHFTLFSNRTLRLNSWGRTGVNYGAGVRKAGQGRFLVKVAPGPLNSPPCVMWSLHGGESRCSQEKPKRSSHH